MGQKIGKQHSADITSYEISEIELCDELNGCIEDVKEKRQLECFPVDTLSRALTALNCMSYKEWSREETQNAFKQLVKMVDTIFEERHLKINENKVSVEETQDDSGMWIICEELFNPIWNHLETTKEESHTDNLKRSPLDSFTEMNAPEPENERRLKKKSKSVAGTKMAKTMYGGRDIRCN